MHLRELDRKSGLSYNTLYHEETTRIDFNTIARICHILGTKVGDLFEYVETEERPKRKAGEIKSKERGK